MIIVVASLTTVHSARGSTHSAYGSVHESSEPDWSEGLTIPETGRPNPYGLEGEELKASIERGRLHALVYPVDITGVTVPYEPFERLVEEDSSNPLKRFILGLFRKVSGFSSVDQVFAWLGLHPYPDESEEGVYSVPYPDGRRPSYRMGVSFVERYGARSFTIGCAACHSSNLFGKSVLGMPNRFPRANEFFIHGKTLTARTPDVLFRSFSGANPDEMRVYSELKENSRFIGAKVPRQLGLDTSLAQVALSLARRAKDPYATKNPRNAASPRADLLDRHAADSKPAPWWNLKYKTRWLLDGSVVSGNPIYTNLLWNEIGRGTNLRELEGWLDRNPQIIRDLTTAVFSSEAPRYEDFFAAETIDRSRAIQGERIFMDRCARCHGTYVKAWSQPGAASLPWKEQIRTLEVKYHPRTPVIDVGTDPGRYQGMVSLEQALNPLEISRSRGIRVDTSKKGYVPPPLVGIWARWPYFHNNSAPSLCAVLAAGERRPKTFYMGEADDPQKSFDPACNGYPLGENTPPEWKRDAKRLFDTSRPGSGRMGHDEGIFLENGRELLSWQDKMALVAFLQTL